VKLCVILYLNIFFHRFSSEWQFYLQELIIFRKGMAKLTTKIVK